MGDAEDINWWEKMMVFSLMDNIIAKLSLTMAMTVWILQVIYAEKPWFYRPMLPGVLLAVGAKYLGKVNFMSYDQTNDADSIWRAYFFHSIWHLLAAGMLVFQSYGLVAHGYPTPKWLTWWVMVGCGCAIYLTAATGLSYLFA